MASPTSILLLMLHLLSIEQQQEISLKPFYSDQTVVVFCYGFHTTVKRKAKSQRQRMIAHINSDERVRLECVAEKAPRFQLRIDH